MKHFSIRPPFKDAGYCLLEFAEVWGKIKQKSCHTDQSCSCTLTHLCFALCFSRSSSLPLVRKAMFPDPRRWCDYMVHPYRHRYGYPKPKEGVAVTCCIRYKHAETRYGSVRMPWQQGQVCFVWFFFFFSSADLEKVDFNKALQTEAASLQSLIHAWSCCFAEPLIHSRTESATGFRFHYEVKFTYFINRFN